MKKLKFALPLVFLASLSAQALSAQTSETRVYRALLSNANEVPAVAAVATGTANVWLHVVRDANGAITSGSIDANVNYLFGAATTITAMHIHTGGATVSGAVVVPFGVARTDVTTAAGSLPPQQTNFPTATVPLDTIKGIVANPGQWYFNVHTTANGGGVMRGQLQPAQVIVRMAQLKPENENPAITGQPWSGVGSYISLITRDPQGTVTSAYSIFDMKYTGFPDDTSFTGMHIHLGAAGGNGGVTLNSGLPSAVAVAAGGAGTLHSESEVNLATAGARQSLDLLSGDTSQLYYNVHTKAFGGGAMRGQVLRTDQTSFQLSPSGAQENPAVNVPNAVGNIQIFTVRKPDSTVAAGVVIFDGNVSFASGTNVTGTHIHDALAGANGPVTIDAALASSPVLVTDGTGNLFRATTVASGQALASLNDLLINPEKHYWNIHTNLNGGGAVRAQMGTAVTSAPAIGTVQSAALAPTQVAVAPGGLVSIFGSNFSKVAGNTAGFNPPSLPTSLNGVSATVGGVPLPLLYVSDTQINAQVPFEIVSSGLPAIVTSASGVSTAVNIVSSVYAPAIFGTPTGPVVIRAKDGSLISATNPAAAGDVLNVIGTGFGQTTPALATGQLTPGDQTYATASVTAKIGGITAAVASSSAITGLSGVYQVTLTVPAGLTAGTAKLQLQMAASPMAIFGAPNYAASNSVDLAVK